MYSNREFLLCTTTSTDWKLLQNCWQTNFSHVMLRSRSLESVSEIVEGRWLAIAVEVGNFEKVGVGYFTSGFGTLLTTMERW